MAVKIWVGGAMRWVRTSKWMSMHVHADMMVCVCMHAHALVKWWVGEGDSEGDSNG